jgi:hypothetical protein
MTGKKTWRKGKKKDGLFFSFSVSGKLKITERSARIYVRDDETLPQERLDETSAL